MNTLAGQGGWVADLIRHIPRRQFVRYLLVGLWNTLFGYGTFALLTAVLNPLVPHSYLWASLISSLVNITVAYLGYKWFIFKTKGNYFREWIRCVGVYSGGIVFTLFALPAVVLLIRRNGRFFNEAPYIAGAILMVVVVLYSFFAHKNFSFRPQPDSDAD